MKCLEISCNTCITSSLSSQAARMVDINDDEVRIKLT